jgi:hypothetical protein
MRTFLFILFLLFSNYVYAKPTYSEFCGVDYFSSLGNKFENYYDFEDRKEAYFLWSMKIENFSNLIPRLSPAETEWIKNEIQSGVESRMAKVYYTDEWTLWRFDNLYSNLNLILSRLSSLDDQDIKEERRNILLLIYILTSTSNYDPLALLSKFGYIDMYYEENLHNLLNEVCLTTVNGLTQLLIHLNEQ